MNKHRFFLVLFLCFGLSISAQQVTSPKDFLGYELGTRFSRHHQVVDYYNKIAAEAPGNIILEQYGTTYEHRPLFLAYISSIENIKNIERIRENNLKQTGMLGGTSGTNDIAVVWLSYNVHGNEASSTEASMKTIYELLTKHQDWLENTVVILDPCLNPDGRDRYINWFNQTTGTPYNIDQQASEHNQPWPYGRSNHYLFDLNRDWFWASQKESQARIKMYNKWLPQIHVDFHEQGRNEPYYFAPAAEPLHEIITDWQRNFQVEIGKNNAKYFDEKGWLFFTRERFDLLYPSYGDTYPTYLGAIGMTYEQAGQAGLGILNDEGEIVTLVDRVAHHTTTGLSTVEISSKNAKKLNEEFKEYFGSTSTMKEKSYVLRGKPDKIEALKKLLDLHEIQYGNAQNTKVSGVVYSTQKNGTFNTTAEDLVINTNQPKGRMVKVLFEPKTKLADSLTYDITAWSLPYVYGVEAISTSTQVPMRQVSSEKPQTSIDGSAVAYIAKWDNMTDAKFLSELLNLNFKVRFTEKSFQTKSPEENFDKGSLIITRGDNGGITDFDTKLVSIANKFNRTLVATHSSFSKSGPDFGSPDVKPVNKPKIAVLSGDGISTLGYGEVWHFFEQQLSYPVTSVRVEDFKNLNLFKYNVLILPDGRYGRLFDDSAMAQLKDWISKGGKLIAIERALNVFADKDGFALKHNKPQDTTAKKNLVPYAQRERESAKNFISGAIFKSRVDTTHPMAFGYEDSYFTLKLDNTSYSLLEKGYNVAWLEDNPKPISGFAGSEALKNIGNSLVFGEEPYGNGSIVYIVDNTLFRSFWENGKLFFVNAVFMVNSNGFGL